MSALPALATAPCSDGLLPEEQEFWDKAFLAAFPIALTVQGWRLGEKPITSGDDRTRLAARWADLAVLARRGRED